MKLGFIGTGNIVSDVIFGISKSKIKYKKIIISPRNKKKALNLKKYFKKVIIAKDNQDVINKANWVFLGILPKVGETILPKLQFRDNQIIVSFMSTTNYQKLRKLIKTKSIIIRAIPMPPIRLGKGPVAIFPPNKKIKDFFDKIGTTIEIRNEKLSKNFWAISGTMASFYELLNVLSKWLIRKKTNKLDAQKYVTLLYSALAELALLKSSKPLKNLVNEQTPGGLNWQGVNELRMSGYYRLLEKSLKKIYKRLWSNSVMQDNILEIKNLSKYFGGLAAVSNCSLKVKQGTITGIIGPNGSGKTTLFNLIAGNLKSSAGSVLFNNENITDVPSYELFSKGLLRTFQIAHEFTNLSVLENLMMVPGNQSGEKLMNALIKPGLVAKEESQIKEKAMEVVDFLNLSHLKNELAGNLSGGQKKLLELGRTMMVDAKLVLLDEVGAGVNRTLLKDLGTAIEKLNKEKGYTFCMIEHDMDFIGRLCDPVIVMAEGSVLFEGSVEDAKKDERVIESYLGRGSKLKDN